MFRQSVNGTCINKPLTGATIHCMTTPEVHASFTRLLDAACAATAKRGPARQVHTEADLRRLLKISPQTANNWKNRGVSLEGAVEAERAFLISAAWVLDGGALHAPTGWTPAQHLAEGVGTYTVAQELSDPTPHDDPLTCTWEFILSAACFPPRFSVGAPDDALAPRTPKGTEFLFQSQDLTAPADGVVVIVQTGGGRRYMRLFFAGAGNEWEARARDAAYPTLHSLRDNLQLLAVATHRAGGQG